MLVFGKKLAQLGGICPTHKLLTVFFFLKISNLQTVTTALDVRSHSGSHVLAVLRRMDIGWAYPQRACCLVLFVLEKQNVIERSHGGLSTQVALFLYSSLVCTSNGIFFFFFFEGQGSSII